MSNPDNRPRAGPGLPDARQAWLSFSLPPLRLEVPAPWFPRISASEPHSARIRWETLVATPLEMNWFWQQSAKGPLSGELLEKRVRTAFERETAAVEKQAKEQALPAVWQEQPGALSDWAPGFSAGLLRRYTWREAPALLAVGALSAGPRQALLAVVLCAPPGCADFPALARRLLGSIRLADPAEPLELCANGLAARLPAGFLPEGLRGQDGQFFFEARGGDEFLRMTRLGISELHLANLDEPRLYGKVARLLLDRGATPDPLLTVVHGGLLLLGRSPGEQTNQELGSGAAQANRHDGAFFPERRRIHVRLGDWLIRRLGRRRWFGPAAALVWACPDTHSILGVCVRCGASDPGERVRQRAAEVFCHGHPIQQELDWLPFVREEGRGPPDQAARARRRRKEEGPAAGKAGGGAAAGVGPESDPVATRRKQLLFRIVARPEVELQRYEKDGSAALLFEGAPAAGLLARFLRGRGRPEVRRRRLALDPVGRAVWEAILERRSVGEVLAQMSATFAVHPVELFPRLLVFLRQLGERHLIEAFVSED